MKIKWKPKRDAFLTCLVEQGFEVVFVDSLAHVVYRNKCRVYVWSHHLLLGHDPSGIKNLYKEWMKPTSCELAVLRDLGLQAALEEFMERTQVHAEHEAKLAFFDCLMQQANQKYGSPTVAKNFLHVKLNQYNDYLFKSRRPPGPDLDMFVEQLSKA